MLIDVCRAHLSGHDVKTARQMGWTAIRNGQLPALVAGRFDVFLTVDRNLSFQQNVSSVPVAVVVIRATSNRLADLRAMLPKILAALASAKPGTVTVAGG